MEFAPKTWRMLSIFLLVSNLALLVHCEQQFPCYFIFGDSLVDNGNNNGLLTTAKANYAPYGIDFPDGPTGRFTNGRNQADILAESFGFDNYIPPFANTSGHDILKGVNYASGAAGIRDETGQKLGAVINLNKQLLNHQIIVSRIAVLLGNETLAKEYLGECIYTVGMGNNDYLNNYFLPQFYPTSLLYTPEQYAEVLIQQYSHQLKTLFNFGARKIGVFELGQLGCVPEMMSMYGTNGSSCVEMITNAVQLFNDKLEVLIDDLNTNLTDAKFIAIQNSGISLGNPSSNDMMVEETPCCRVSDNIGKGQCIPEEVPCSDRDEYVYWDAFHPTEVANIVLAEIAYSSLSQLQSSWAALSKA